jgi:signal transduction histidine kinase
MKKESTLSEEHHIYWGDAPVPCMLLDRRGKIVTVNPAAAALLERDVAGPWGIDVKGLLSPSTAVHDKLRSRRKDRFNEDVHVMLKTFKGKETPVSIRIQRYSGSGKGIHTVLWLQCNREAHELRRRLERTEKLSAVAIVAGKVAHEIRTPLNSICLNNDLLMERVGKMRGAQAQKLRRYLEILQEEVDRINEVVGSYLSLARLAGSDRCPTTVEHFLKEFIDEVQEEYLRQGITITSAFRTRRRQLTLNQRQFRRVMINLFSNSRDAMKGGGVITVSTEDSDGEFRITVSDTGDGIQPEVLSRLTTPFTSYKSNGSGLGLYLVQEIVEHHGGRLDIRSLQGEGTSVIIALPREEKR